MFQNKSKNNFFTCKCFFKELFTDLNPKTVNFCLRNLKSILQTYIFYKKLNSANLKKFKFLILFNNQTQIELIQIIAVFCEDIVEKTQKKNTFFYIYLLLTFKLFYNNLQQSKVKHLKHQQMWLQKNSFQHVQDHLPKQNLLGDKNIFKTVECFTEFDPLEVVIIGNIDDTSRCWNGIVQYDDFQNFYDNFGLDETDKDRIKQAEKRVDIYPEQLVKTTQNQQEKIVTELQKRGVQVVRTGFVDHSVEFQTNGRKTTGYSNFNARDLIFTYDDCLYEFPTPIHCRKQQLRGFQWIQQQVHHNGSKIFSAPNLTYDYILYEKPENKQIYKSDLIFADAANLIKLGLDILFQISITGSWGCYRKLRQMLEKKYDKKVRVHPVCDVYEGVHIDTTFSVIGFNKKIGKFIVIVDGQDVNPRNMPAIFRGKNWAVIDIGEVIDQNPDFKEYNAASEMIALNVLSINSQLVMMSDKQTRIHEILQHYGIEVIKMPHTYARQVDGGFHCMSNDIRRKDTFEFKKILDATSQEQIDKNKLSGLFDPQLLQILQSKGDLQEWVNICNQKEIYPTYLTDHMSKEEKISMDQRHKRSMK